MKSGMIKFLVTVLITILALLTSSIFMQKSVNSKNTAIDMLNNTFVSTLHDDKNSNLGSVAERTATVSIAENNNSSSLINTSDRLEYDFDSQKSTIASKTLRSGTKQINKRSETILRDKTSEIISKKDLPTEDDLYFRNSEFNEYPNRTSYRFNVVLALFLPKESEMGSKIAIVCINSFYDSEDEYNIVLVSGRYPGKPYRDYATYQDEIDMKLKTMDLEQKLLYFLRKALWCDNMLIQDHYIRKTNDKVIKILCDGYKYLQQRKSRSKYRKASYLYVCDD